MQISLPAMLRWVLPAAAVLWVIGAWPMWHWAGGGGLVAHTAAACIVLGVMLASAVIVTLCAEVGPASAAFAFIAASLVRIALCVGITIAIWSAFSLPAGVLCFSTLASYLTTLLAETIWLSRALNRNAMLPARTGPAATTQTTEQ